MNCFELHRRLMADPYDQDEAIKAHCENCPSCAAFVSRLGHFETTLECAARVPVPEGLASRIILRENIQDHQQRRKTRRTGAIAAFAAASVLFVTLALSPSPAHLDEAVITHIYDELPHLMERGNLQTAEVNAVLQPIGSQFKEKPGEITFAGRCPIRKYEGAHLVLKGYRGPVTVLIMPGEFVERRMPVRDKAFNGVIVPTQAGSVAIIGEPGEHLAEIEARVMSQLIIRS